MSAGALTTSATPRAASIAASTPASGPAKSGTLSATTGRPKDAKRVGSPLALMIEPGALRREALDGELDDRAAANLKQRLVAPAHAPRQTARQKHPETLPHCSTTLAGTAAHFDLV